jgi:nucleotide-binding universal stress UspA family protein
MKTVIIPVDFSETSLNAARYAAEMLSGKSDTSIILYNMVTNAEEYELAGTYLESIKTELLLKGDKSIECIRENGKDLIDCLETLVSSKKASLIIMGISEKSLLQQTLVGSNTLKIVARGVCPVLIVPVQAKYNGIKHVALASDFRNVETNTPVKRIKSVLDLFKPKLHIVHVNSEIHVAINEQLKTEKNWLDEQFREYDPEFYFLTTFDLQESIEQFSQDQQIDFIINVPHHQSFYDHFFKKSVTKKLIFQSTIPILAAHD